MKINVILALILVLLLSAIAIVLVVIPLITKDENSDVSTTAEKGQEDAGLIVAGTFLIIALVAVVLSIVMEHERRRE